MPVNARLATTALPLPSVRVLCERNGWVGFAMINANPAERPGHPPLPAPAGPAEQPRTHPESLGSAANRGAAVAPPNCSPIPRPLRRPAGGREHVLR